MTSSQANLTYWCSGDTDADPWVLLDLGQLYHVTGFHIRLPIEGPVFEAVSALGSSDGVSWLAYGNIDPDITVSEPLAIILHRFMA